MFKHIIFIKLNDKQDTTEVKQILENLKSEIPQIMSLEVGVDEFCSERSCDIVLITSFENEEDYRIYDTHPAHIPVKNRIQELKKESYSVDYNI